MRVADFVLLLKMKLYLENISMISPVLKCLPNTDITRRLFIYLFFVFARKEL